MSEVETNETLVTEDSDRTQLIGRVIGLFNAIDRVGDVKAEIASSGSVATVAPEIRSRVEAVEADDSSELFRNRLNVIDTWQDLFHDEILSTKLVRDVLVHGTELDNDTLVETIDLESKLLNLLQARLVDL